jgi:thiosulfate dehydrogenase
MEEGEKMKRIIITAGMFFMVGTLVWVISGLFGCIFLPSSLVRGGLLYDKWWEVLGVLDTIEPTADHPLYPDVGEKSGSSTWRCKECHGWDYMGVDGAYGSGSHFTGIDGIFSSRNKSESELTNILTTGDHDFSTHLAERDIADIVVFIRDGLIDMSAYIDSSSKEAMGDAMNGETLYARSGLCIICHGSDGKSIDFGEGEGVGDLARDNPWEVLHKIRFGSPGTIMPSAIENGLSVDEQVDILTYSQIL